MGRQTKGRGVKAAPDSLTHADVLAALAIADTKLLRRLVRQMADDWGHGQLLALCVHVAETINQVQNGAVQS